MGLVKKYLSTLCLLAVCLSVSNVIYAQNISINEGGTSPDSSAMLDVSSTDKGILIPRMTAAERLAITNPANGLLVFQTDGNNGFYVYSTSTNVWEKLAFDSNLDLSAVLAAGADANNDTIVNLNALAIGQQNPPITSFQLDSFVVIQGTPFNGFRWFGFNAFYDGVSANPSYIYDGEAAILAKGNSRLVLGFWNSGTAGNALASDASSSIALENNRVVIDGDLNSLTIDLRGVVTADSLNINSAYGMPSFAGGINQILKVDTSGTLRWGNPLWQENGANIFYTSGNVGINNNNPTAELDVQGNFRLADGTEGAGKVLVSDINGNASWKRSSIYNSVSGLNSSSINVNTTWQPIGPALIINKVHANSVVEVTVNTSATVGSFDLTAGEVQFEIRINGVASSIDSKAVIRNGLNNNDVISMMAVFNSLSTGSHTVQIFTRSYGGNAFGVLLDSGGFGGAIIAKETF